MWYWRIVDATMTYSNIENFYFVIYVRTYVGVCICAYLRWTVKQPYKFIKKTGYLFRENCAKYTVTCGIYRFSYIDMRCAYIILLNLQLMLYMWWICLLRQRENRRFAIILYTCAHRYPIISLETLYIKDMGHLYNIERNLCIQW